MNRFRSYFPQDETPVAFGDGSWKGVHPNLFPGQIPEGYGSHGVNVRFDRGTVQPRKGIRLLSWGAKSGNPYEGLPGRINGYGPVAGSGVFNDPTSGLTWIITACRDGKVWRARPGSLSLEMDVPAGETIPDRVQLLQTFNGIVMFRGADADPLFCENLDDGFQVIPDPARGKIRLPRSSAACFAQNRLVAVYAGTNDALRDSIFVSDAGGITDVLQGPVNFQAFRINQGSRDALVAVYPFGQSSFLALKENSIYVVGNVSGTNEDIAANATLTPVANEYGIRAPRAVVQVGSDVWFLSHKRGICSLQLTINNAVQAVDLPKSKAIDPYIHRINWRAAVNAVACMWDNKVYFAVPIDGSEHNNAVLVFQTQTGEWAGYDSGAAIRVRDWLEFEIGGQIRAVMCSDDGYLSIYEDGFLDQVPGPNGTVIMSSVQSNFWTRGYGGDTAGKKRFGNMQYEVATWWPQYSIRAHFDGVNEFKAVVNGRTASRTRYSRPYGKTAWDPTNVNDDHADPGRGDYSIAPSSSGIYTGQSGLLTSEHQITEAGHRINKSARYVQFELIGTQGRTELNGLSVEGFRVAPRATVTT